MKTKKPNFVLISVAVLVVAILVAIFYFLRTKDYEKHSESKIYSYSPNRSFHEEVDATTQATFLWNAQSKQENLKVPGDEKLGIVYPFMNSVFPADFSPASFIWKSAEPKEIKWKISFRSTSGYNYKTSTKETQFVPDKEVWEKLKKESANQQIEFSVKGDGLARSVVFSFSKDSVVAPVFYRGTPLPFSYANKYRDRLKWYLGDLTTNRKHVMLENMPVCANCHSFSKDGASFGMDVDYGNDKGNYAISEIEEESKIGIDNIVSWTNYKKEDGIKTFGLLAKLSPNGKYAVCTVKDKSIFVPVDKSFWYSQLFFPVKGILVYYDIENEKFVELEGASSSEFVQSSPEWAPDMSNLLFSRAVYHKDTSLEAQENVVLDMRFAEDYIKRDKEFKFDLYKVPWNDGNGGEPVAIKGASNNGMSNYFARYSPNGKWIVFCKAENFMLLQSDSKLYIMPAEGGDPRLMNCNTNEMNSWHSFSPNGKWLVFATKYFGPYTQLFLTHIDENGNDTPPIWLEQLSVNKKALNIPEFVNTDYDGWHIIKDDFTNTETYATTVAKYKYETQNLNTIITEADTKISDNPDDYHGYYLKAVMLSQNGKNEEAKESAQKCIGMIESVSDKGFKEYGDLGLTYFIAGDLNNAIVMSKKALEIKPDYLFAMMTLGDVYFQMRDYENTNKVYSEIIDLNNSVDYRLKRAQLKMGARQLYKEAIEDLDVILDSEDCQVMALQMLISCYAGLNDTEMVEKTSAKLIGCDPYTGYFSRGNNYFKSGEYQKAIDDFTEGLKYKNDDLRAVFFRANSYFALKDYSHALIDFENLKVLTKKDPRQLPINPQKLDEIIRKCKQNSGQ